MRKVIYFNKENAKLLDNLTVDKLDDFSNYICGLIRNDLEGEELKDITSDLQEIKRKLDTIQSSIKNGVPTTCNVVSDDEDDDLSMTLEMI